MEMKQATSFGGFRVYAALHPASRSQISLSNG
jgi:hypothetical protein